MAVKAGRLKRKDLPKFKHMIISKNIKKSDVIVDKSNINCDPVDFNKQRKSCKFYDNPYFKDVYNVMKLGREELSDCVQQQRKVLYERKPMDFAEPDDEYENRDPTVMWTWLAN